MKKHTATNSSHKNNEHLKNRRKIRYKIRVFLIIIVFIKSRLLSIYKYLALIIFAMTIASSNREMVSVKNVSIQTGHKLTIINTKLRSTKDDLEKTKILCQNLEKKNIHLININSNLENYQNELENKIQDKSLEFQYKLKNERIKISGIEKKLQLKISRINQLENNLIINKQQISRIKTEKKELELCLNNFEYNQNLLKKKLDEREKKIYNLEGQIAIQQNEFKEQFRNLRFEVHNMSVKMTMLERRQFLAPIMHILSKKLF
jgi:predicted  nucleic acid-binding Zn-ribbon protein